MVLHLEAPHELDSLSRLNVNLPGWPVLVLMGEDHRSNGSRGDGIIDIMRAGASQIVSVPLQTHDFKAVLDRIAIQFVYSGSDSKVIAVAGATGGSGATTLAINIAFENRPPATCIRCILADLSLQDGGGPAAHLNIEPASIRSSDLLRDVDRLDTTLVQKVLIRVAENFEILAGPKEFVAPVSISSEDVNPRHWNLETASRRRCGGRTVHLPMMSTSTPSPAHDRVVLIGEQKLPSIRALKMVSDRLGRATGTEFLVINRFDPNLKGFAVDSLLTPLGASRLYTVARDDLAMRAAVQAGCVLRFAVPQSPVLTDIVALVKTLLNRDSSTAPVKPSGLFAQLGRAARQ